MINRLVTSRKFLVNFGLALSVVCLFIYSRQDGLQQNGERPPGFRMPPPRTIAEPSLGGEDGAQDEEPAAAGEEKSLEGGAQWVNFEFDGLFLP